MFQEVRINVQKRFVSSCLRSGGTRPAVIVEADGHWRRKTCCGGPYIAARADFLRSAATRGFWYENSNGLEERAKEDEEFARLINEVKREQKAAAALNEAMGELPQSVWQRLEQSVEEERREQSRGSGRTRTGTVRRPVYSPQG